jgi:hypothetical protein
MTRHEIGRRIVTVLLGLLIFALLGFAFREFNDYRTQQLNALSPWAQEVYGVPYVTSELRAEYGNVDNEELERLAGLRRDLLRDCEQLTPKHGIRSLDRRVQSPWRCVITANSDPVRQARLGFKVRLTVEFQTGPRLHNFYRATPFDALGCASMAHHHFQFAADTAYPGYGLPDEVFPMPDPAPEYRDFIEQQFHRGWEAIAENDPFCVHVPIIRINQIEYLTTEEN